MKEPSEGYLVVARDEEVAVVHAGAVDCEPVDHADVVSVFVLESQDGDDLVRVGGILSTLGSWVRQIRSW